MIWIYLNKLILGTRMKEKKNHLTYCAVSQIQFRRCRVSHKCSCYGLGSGWTQAMVFNVNLLPCDVLDNKGDWNDTELRAGIPVCFSTQQSEWNRNINLLQKLAVFVIKHPPRDNNYGKTTFQLKIYLMECIDM